MPVPVYSELKNLSFDRAGINVSVDAPVSDTEFARFINDAGRDVWQASGSRLKVADSAAAWDLAQLATGTAYGLLTDIDEIVHLYGTTTVPAAIVSASTSGSKAVTSAALFGAIVPGMSVSGANITSGSLVRSVTSSSALTITQNATATGATTLTFSPTVGSIELERVELSEIKYLRTQSGFPTYLVPKKYAVVRAQSNSVIANVNLMKLEYWPGITGYYFPIEYAAQWVDIDSATNTTPDLNDIEATDAALIAAMRIAQLVGRADLVPGIIADISTRTQAYLERKLSSLVDSKQDK